MALLQQSSWGGLLVRKLGPIWIRSRTTCGVFGAKRHWWRPISDCFCGSYVRAPRDFRRKKASRLFRFARFPPTWCSIEAINIAVRTLLSIRRMSFLWNPPLIPSIPFSMEISLGHDPVSCSTLQGVLGDITSGRNGVQARSQVPGLQSRHLIPSSIKVSRFNGCRDASK